MSYQGIHIAANVISALQTARLELVSLGAKDAASQSGQQDILLGRMCEEMNDLIKDKFAKIVSMKTEPPKLANAP